MDQNQNAQNSAEQVMQQAGAVAKKPKKGLVALLGLLLVAVIAVAVFFMLRGTSDAQSDMDKAMQKLFSDDEDVSVKMNLEIGGFIAMNMSGHIKLDSDNDLTEVNIGIAVPEAGFDFGADVVGNDDVAYLKMNGFSELVSTSEITAADEAELAQLGLSVEDLLAIDGNWYKMDQESAQKFLEGVEAYTVPGTLSLDVSEAEIERQNAELEKLGDIYQENPLFVVGEEIDSKEISGRSATGYKVALADQATIDNFMNELKSIDIPGWSEAFDQLGDTTVDGAGETVDGLEVWLDGDNLVQIAYAQTGIDFSIDVLDEDVSIELPTDAQDFDGSPLSNYFDAIISQSASVASEYESTQLRAQDLVRQTDLNAVRTMLEVYYTDNGQYPLESNTSGLINLGLDPSALVTPEGGSYIYEPVNCNATGCEYYTISADLEEDGLGAADVDGEVRDLIESSLN